MRTTIIVLALLFTARAGAQEEVILLQPFTVATEKQEVLPPITIRKTGDYLLLQVRIVNDTRDPDKRRAELYDTIKGIITAKDRVHLLEISTREMVLTQQNYAVRLSNEQAKADTSSVELLFRLPLSPSDDVGALTKQLREFSQATSGIGRTEIFPGEIGISVKNPERFRYELIGRIAEDVKKTKNLFGESFEIIVNGLDQRLKWRRTSTSELEFYLAYSYSVLPSKSIPLIIGDKS